MHLFILFHEGYFLSYNFSIFYSYHNSLGSPLTSGLRDTVEVIDMLYLFCTVKL